MKEDTYPVKVIGRPKGVKKVPLNIYMEKKVANKLKILAATEQKTISIMVVNALKLAYNF